MVFLFILVGLLIAANPTTYG